jgi:hypothetical protein
MYIDFKALKSRVEVEVVAAMLELPIGYDDRAEQWRGPCPRCQEGGDRALVVTPGKGFYCFAKKTGGDCIALAAHILDLPMRDAAAYIIDHLGDDGVHAGAGDGHDDAADDPLTCAHPHAHGGTDANADGDRRISPAKAVREQQPGGAGPFQPLSYLLFDHPEVQRLGLNVDTARALGIGYAKKGIMRGRVAIPLRGDDGTLVGYCGFTPTGEPMLKFPSALTRPGNVR